MSARVTMTTLAFALVAAAGCSKSSRTDVTGQGLSVSGLDDWSRTDDHGSAVFHDLDSHATIAIRSVPFEGREHGPRTAAGVLAATKLVLERLPKATIHSSYAVPNEQFKIRTFELTYTPPGKQRPYERRHTVIIGQTRIFHLWLTGPAADFDAASSVFNRVVRSVQEEG